MATSALQKLYGNRGTMYSPNNIPLTQAGAASYQNMGGNINQMKQYPSYNPQASDFQDMGISGENYGNSSMAPTPDLSSGSSWGGISDAWNGIKNYDYKGLFTGSKDNPSIAQNVAGGISALGSLYGAYQTGKYQDKIAGLQQQQQDLYRQQQERTNARQDLAQKNYDSSFR